MARVRDMDRLHPEMQAKVQALLAKLAGSQWKWKVYETWRKPKSKCGDFSKVSNTNPCKNPSRHGYGAAADIVPFGTWSGKPVGKKKAPWAKASWPGWAELRQAAHAVGLDNDISWDRPHVEVKRSEITRWLQKAIGVAPDGKWGPATEHAAKQRAAALGIEWKQPVPTASPRVHPDTYNAIIAAKKNTLTATGAAIGIGAVVAVAAIAWLLIKGKKS